MSETIIGMIQFPNITPYSSVDFPRQSLTHIAEQLGEIEIYPLHDELFEET